MSVKARPVAWHLAALVCLLIVPFGSSCDHEKRLRDLEWHVAQLDSRIESIWLIVSQHSEQLASISSSLRELQASYFAVASKLDDTIGVLHAQNVLRANEYQTLRSAIDSLRSRAQALTNISETNRQNIGRLHSELEYLRAKIRKAVQILLSESEKNNVSSVSHSHWSSPL